MYAIETVNLTKRYGEITAVNGVELKIVGGEIFSLLGVNGAGKTTTVKMLSGLTKPTEGEIFIEGKSSLSDTETIKKIVSLSPQETAVAPNLTVRENLDFILGIHGVQRRERVEKIKGISAKLRLGEVMERRAGKLSGGWQRRLSIAMALISEPRILFLDEPTLGLDVIARSELWDIIRALRGKVTVIMTTHYMEEAEALSDRIGIMNKGKILTVGTPRELMEKTGTSSVEDAFLTVVKGVME